MRQQNGRPRGALRQRARENTGQDNEKIITRRIIPRAVKIMDAAAMLSDDVATLAARIGRASHACAATHLSLAANHAWAAAEVLAESAGA